MNKRKDNYTDQNDYKKQVYFNLCICNTSILYCIERGRSLVKKKRTFLTSIYERSKIYGPIFMMEPPDQLMHFTYKTNVYFLLKKRKGKKILCF